MFGFDKNFDLVMNVVLGLSWVLSENIVDFEEVCEFVCCFMLVGELLLGGCGVYFDVDCLVMVVGVL